jgi:hypothetical protein
MLQMHNQFRGNLPGNQIKFLRWPGCSWFRDPRSRGVNEQWLKSFTEGGHGYLNFQLSLPFSFLQTPKTWLDWPVQKVFSSKPFSSLFLSFCLGAG